MTALLPWRLQVRKQTCDLIALLHHAAPVARYYMFMEVCVCGGGDGGWGWGGGQLPHSRAG